MAAVAVPTAVSSVLTAINGWDRTSTISRHIARRRSTTVVFAITETSANLVLVMYVWLVLFAQSRLWLVTCLLITLIQVLVVVAALVPHTFGWRVRVHQWSAWRAVGLCFILSYLLLVQGSLHKVAWLVGVTAAYALFMTMSLLAYRSKFLARNWIFAEFGVFIGFGVTVLAFGLGPPP